MMLLLMFWSVQDFNRQPPNFKSGTLTNRSCSLDKAFSVIYLFIYLFAQDHHYYNNSYYNAIQNNQEQEVSEAFLGLSRRPPLLPDNTSLAVNDLQIFYIDLQIRK